MKRRRYNTERLPGMERFSISDIGAGEIKRFVREALLGFPLRQKYREYTRKQKREASKRRASGPREVRPPKGNEVKSPIVFRAQFKGPKWTTFQLPGPVDVELYHSAIGPPAEWRARRPGTKNDFEKITPQSMVETLKRQMEQFFEEQISQWEAFDTTMPKALQLLKREDWATDNQGKVYLTKDYIDHRAVVLAGMKNPRTVGEVVAQGPVRVK